MRAGTRRATSRPRGRTGAGSVAVVSLLVVAVAAATFTVGAAAPASAAPSTSSTGAEVSTAAAASTAAAVQPLAAPEPTDATEVVAGYEHACALRRDGKVKCWGWNAHGQLGLGDNLSRGQAASTMGNHLPTVALGTGRTATALAAGESFTCALLDNGQVKCWGNNSGGMLGQGDVEPRGIGPGEMGDDLAPVALGAGRTATAISAGASHVCALLDDGSVKCWGYNNRGALGLGDQNHRGDGPNEMGDDLPTVDLGTGRTATAIAAGYGHTCAILDNGQLKCWGSNYGGALGGLGAQDDRGDGPGEMGDNLPPVDLGAGRTASSVAAGYGHTCAILDNGELKCWGAGFYGELGQGNTSSVYGGIGLLPAVDLGTGRTAVEVSASPGQTCARLDDGSAKCWGANAVGALGLGDANNRGDQPGEMGDALPALDLGAGHTVAAIGGFGLSFCAVLDAGAVKCWGWNHSGQLGLGDTDTRGDGPGEMGDALPVVDLGGPDLRVVLGASQRRVAPGDEIHLRVYLKNVGEWPLTGVTISDPGEPDCEQAVPDLAVGEERTITCVHQTQPGDDGTIHEHVVTVDTAETAPVASSPLRVPIAEPVDRPQVAAGRARSCAILANGWVKCWGQNLYGHLGVGDTNDRGGAPGTMGTALPRVALGAGRTATSLAVGASHTCALLDDGTVKCWGYNDHGELGLGDTTWRGGAPGQMGGALPAVDLGTGRTATAIAAGRTHTCALLDDGTVKCWGQGQFGQLGLGTFGARGDGPGEMGDALPAVDLGAGRTAVAISASELHTCAVLDDGHVKCWGNGGLGFGSYFSSVGNQPGQMGDALPAVDLGTGRRATAVATGDYHSCALLDDGAVKCWGGQTQYSSYGVLGLGDTLGRGEQPGDMGDALPPVDLGAAHSAVAISAGGTHTCALLEDGSVKCWGINYYGELGLGDTAIRGDGPGEMGDALPALDLGTGRTATGLSSGDLHTCAVLDDGSVKCWGDNDAGQLGQGDTSYRGDQPGEMGDALPPIVLAGPELTVHKSSSEASVGAGAPIHFQVEIANTGIGPLTGITVDDPNGADCEQAVPDLAEGEVHTVECTYDTSVADVGSYTNTATVDSDQTAAVTSNTVSVTVRPLLTVTKTADESVVAPGGTIHMHVKVQATGASALTGLVIDDANGPDCEQAIPDLAAGESHTIDCTYTTDSGAEGTTYTNVAVVDSDQTAPRSSNTLSVPVTSGASAIAVAAGDSHSCAVLGDGRVKCWGYNDSGQLGLGDRVARGDGPGEMGDALGAVDLGTGHTATAVAVGSSHSCALLDDGSVKCWGGNDYGQLGLGDTANRGDGPGELGDALPTVALGTGRTAVAISAGGSVTCAQLDDGSVKCWGAGFSGELGQGDTSTRGDGPGELGDALPPVALGTGRTATRVVVARSGAHVCALLDDGSVKCWGTGYYGELGQGDTMSRGYGPGQMGDALPAVDLGPGRTATSITAGGYHTCATLDDGSVKCWGYNGSGQLGLGDTDTRGDGPGEMGAALSPVDLGSGRTAIAVVAGSEHTCAVLDGGDLKCWGSNWGGQLGVGDANGRGTAPGEMGDALPVTDLGASVTGVALGGYSSCALLGGSVKCWGYNGSGNLGLGDVDFRGDQSGEMGSDLPVVDLGGPAPPFTVTKLADERFVTPGSEIHLHLRVVNTGGAPLTGITVTDPNAPDCDAAVPDLPAVWASHTIDCTYTARLRDVGTYTNVATGDSDQAGPVDSNEVEVEVGVIDQAVAATTGSTHACAVLADGRVKCWGGNDNGQLGLGDTTRRGQGPGEMGNALPAVDLGTGRTVVQVGAGAAHTCALLDDGSVRCWGGNAGGQLGLGDTDSRGDGPGEMGDALPAVDLGTGRTATAITVGSNHTCALLDDGSVKCWGLNNGHLGLGDYASRGGAPGEMGDALPAVDLGTGRTAVAISAGDGHTCAVLDDGSLKCWGDNWGGQLGLGDTTYRGGAPHQMGDDLPAVDLGPGRTAISVDVGDFHTCAVLDDGSVKCWGYGSSGQLGLGNSSWVGYAGGQMGADLPAVDLGPGRTAVSVTAGNGFTCAVLDDGSVKCWGASFPGALGQGDTNPRGDGPGEMGAALPPVDLGVGRTATTISAGSDFACALLDDGRVKCWGFNVDGRLGQGDTADRGDGPGEMGGALAPINLGGNPPPAALSVTKSVDETEVHAGDTIHLHVRVENTGGSTMTGITISDDHGPDCEQSVPDLRAGDDHVVDCTYETDAGDIGTYTNVATVDSDQTEAVDSNEVSVDVTQAVPALTVAVTADETSVDAGATVHLHVKVTNTGGVALTGLTVTDAHAPDCVRTVPDLAVGADHTIDCAYVTGPRDLGTYTNAATVDSTQTDPVTSGQVSVGVTLASGFGVLQGHVTDAGSGDAIDGALVAALSPGTYSVVGADVSRADGSYALLAPAGSQFLYLVDPSGDHAARFVTPMPTAVGDGQVVALDVTMAPALGGISGRIVDDVSGAPLPTVLAMDVDLTTGLFAGVGAADGAGDFVVDGLRARDHLVVYADLAGAHRPEYHADAPAPVGVTPVTVAAGTTQALGTAGLAPVAPPSGSARVEGTVTSSGGGPVEGAVVVALNAANYQMEAGDRPDANGDYEIPVDTGDYIVGIVDPSGDHRFEWYADQPASGLGSATAVHAAPSSPAVVDAEVGATRGAVTGTVTEDGSGDALHGVLVAAIDERGAIVGVARTDIDGGYRFADLAEVPVRIRFIDLTGQHRSEYHDDVDGTDAAAGYTAATVVHPEGGTVTTIDAGLDPRP